MNLNPSEHPNDTPEVTMPPTPVEPTTPAQPPVAPSATHISQPKSKKWLMWVIPLALILIAGLLAAGYYLGKQQPNDKQTNATITSGSTDTRDNDKKEPEVNEDTPEAPVDAYAGWSDSSAIDPPGPSSGYVPAFTFKYPAGWNHIKPRGPACGIIVSPTATSWSNTDPIVCVGTDSTYDGALQGAAAQTLGQPVASSRSLTVNGHAALQVESQPQNDGQQTTIKMVTVVDNVNRGSAYGEPGILVVTGTYVGRPNGFDAFKKEYQLIVDSVELTL